MNPMKRQLTVFGWYFLIALPFFIVGFSGFFSILSPLFFFLGALIVAAPFAGVIAEPFGNLYYGWNRKSDPKPQFSQVQAKRMSGDFEEALKELEIMAATYPQEVDVWVEMLDIVILDLDDTERSLTILQRGKEILEKAADRTALNHVYEANLKLRENRNQSA